MATQKALVVENGTQAAVGDTDTLIVGQGLDAATATDLAIGGANATSITVGSSGIITEFKGVLSLDAVTAPPVAPAGTARIFFDSATNTIKTSENGGSYQTVPVGTVQVSGGGTGRTSLTANNVVVGDGTSQVKLIAPVTSGDVLTWSGTAWVSAPPAAGTGGVSNVTATAPILSSGGAFPDISLTAGTNVNDVLSWNGSAWVSVPPSGGGVALVTASSPLASSGGATPDISLTGVVAVANGGTGQSSLTLNNVVLGNGTSAVQTVAPGTSGNVLTSNGTTWQSVAPSAAVSSVTGSGGTTGLTFTGGPTGAVTLTLDGILVAIHGGTGTSTAFTEGSVVFAGASGAYSQKNTNFFWDNTNNRLGIDTTTPAAALSIGTGSLFRVSSTGNVTRINDVVTSFPNVQGGVNTLLQNDGSGNLAWVTQASLSVGSATTAGNVSGTVGIGNGGTGATTASGARTNLGVPSTSGTNASGTWGINITGSAGSATQATSSANINAILNTNVNATHYPVFVSATGGSLAPYTDSTLTFNPSTNTLSTTTFSGAFSGSGASLTSLNASNISSGTLAVARGGTGASSFTNATVVIVGAAGTFQSAGTGTAGQLLKSQGLGSIPTWQDVAVSPNYTANTVAIRDASGNLASNRLTVGVDDTAAATYRPVFATTNTTAAGTYAVNIDAGLTYRPDTNLLTATNMTCTTTFTNTGMTMGTVASTVSRTSGNVLITGASDSRFKKDVRIIENALSIVNALRGVYFKWDNSKVPEGDFLIDPELAEIDRIGFIAQEVQSLLPELIYKTGSKDYLGVQYPEVTAVLVEAIKELTIKNQALEQTVETLAARLAALESKG